MRGNLNVGKITEMEKEANSRLCNSSNERLHKLKYLSILNRWGHMYRMR